MEMVAGAGLFRSNYFAHIDSGKGVGPASTASSSFQSCRSCLNEFHRNASAFRSAGCDFSNLVSIGDSQFPLKASACAPGTRYWNSTAKATGNGAFTGGNRAEDMNEALSTVLPHTVIDKDSAAFRAILAAIASVALASEKQRMHEKTDVPVDALRQGRLVESRLVYRQTFVIRSYEIGADRTASIDTFMNHFQVFETNSFPFSSFFTFCTFLHMLTHFGATFSTLRLIFAHFCTFLLIFAHGLIKWAVLIEKFSVQETALNHVWMSGLAGDGFGATRAMSSRNLIWVVTRMQVHVEQYPAWGDVVEMDTWVAASGKNGMRRDWLVRDYKTGQILARATSTWVMMSRKTRKLSKMPEEVRAEISPYFLERSAIKDESLLAQKILRLNDNAECVRSGLTPKRTDLDMNQHVNNVKYIGWMMESVPPAIMDGYELASMSLEYRRECGQSDMVQSMTSLEPSTSDAESGEGSNGPSKSCHSFSKEGASPSARMPEMKHTVADMSYLKFVHLLRMENDGAEIVRGRTCWRARNNPIPLI
ncbi:hypothetical protein M758_8G167200 [Ceratodon purpureus]|nr:hypothetical protein M758_8G167200 [Ceratodon purpureus]